jgi:hypothetical protein
MVARGPLESDRRGLLRRRESDGGLAWVTGRQSWLYLYEAKSREKLTKNFHRIDTGTVRALPGLVMAAGGSVAGRSQASVERGDRGWR